jgi:hypothetical protein
LNVVSKVGPSFNPSVFLGINISYSKKLDWDKLF